MIVSRREATDQSTRGFGDHALMKKQHLEIPSQAINSVDENTAERLARTLPLHNRLRNCVVIQETVDFYLQIS